MMDWIKARLSEGNSRRALAVLVVVLGATHILDADMLGAAAESLDKLGLLFLAFDAFVTPQASK